jgi:hypothetical protein
MSSLEIIFTGELFFLFSLLSVHSHTLLFKIRKHELVVKVSCFYCIAYVII